MTESGEGLPGFSPEFIEQKKAEHHRLRRLTTVKFDDEEKRARFLEYVFDKYGEPYGLEFTNSAVPGTICVTPELLEEVYDKFPMRPLRLGEEQEYLDSLPGTRPFDPESIRGRHVFGLGYFRREKRST